MVDLRQAISDCSGSCSIPLECATYAIPANDPIIISGKNVQLHGCGDSTEFQVISGGNDGPLGEAAISIEDGARVEIDRVSISLDEICTTSCPTSGSLRAAVMAKGLNTRLRMHHISCTTKQTPESTALMLACIATREPYSEGHESDVDEDFPRDFVLSDCSVSSGTRHGVYLRECHNCLVENCRFSYNRTAPGGSPPNVGNTYLLTKRTGVGVVLQNNLFDMQADIPFFDPDADPPLAPTRLSGLRMEGLDQQLAMATGNTFRNLIPYSDQVAIELYNYKHGIIRGNVLIGNFGAPGARGIGSMAANPVDAETCDPGPCEPDNEQPSNAYMVVTDNQFVDWNVENSAQTSCPIFLSGTPENKKSVDWVIGSNQFYIDGSALDEIDNVVCGEDSKRTSVPNPTSSGPVIKHNEIH